VRAGKAVVSVKWLAVLVHHRSTVSTAKKSLNDGEYPGNSETRGRLPGNFREPSSHGGTRT
jgi:hypothetical protein